MNDMNGAARPHRIEDHALIGSGHSAALVHRDGTIAWLCLPRFDSDAVFASLLGNDENGSWKLHATDPAARVSRRYLPDTLVLETSIQTATGRARVLDFMPIPATGGTRELVRLIEVDEGRVEFRTDLQLRFNYGLSKPWMRRCGGMLLAVAGPDAIRISAPVNLDDREFTGSATFVVNAQQRVPLMLEWYASHEEPPLPRDAFALLWQVEYETRRWAGRCRVEGPYQGAVRRSLLTLKAMTYHPTGGIVAAPTTSLPETFGGVRNWDYRYCWLRDAVFTIYALTSSGFVEEASAWRWWLMRAAGGAPEALQIMYGLHGERRLNEFELDHLAGFENSRPVRVGNAASVQRQLDVYGAVLAAFDGARRLGLDEMDVVWPLERAIADRLACIWKEPDSGLWEQRGPPQHFVHSKAMCWLAFDRLVASATDFGLDGPVDTWRQIRDEIHADVCARGFDAASNSFVRYYGADDVDAALLMLPTIGFLAADDPRMRGTIERIERDLLKDGVVYRYINRPEDADHDGLEGTEGAFLACSFWLCDAYVLSGRRDDAVALFERLLSFGNDLGLFAEEYDPVARRQLGNFPQAFTHLALVNSAHTLGSSTRGVADVLADGSGRQQGDAGNAAAARGPAGGPAFA